MTLPFFYVKELSEGELSLDEDTSKHMIMVLRMHKGDKVLLTDGRGQKAEAEIFDDHRKKTRVRILNLTSEKPSGIKTAIGISLIKNPSRFEWFLEKATEIGITEIYPLICTRTEKEKFRQERLQQILVSAMLQSQQSILPVLHEPIPFVECISLMFDLKMIAHCVPEQKTLLSTELVSPHSSRLILIGPEGDFTQDEIESALSKKFIPVSLGHTRLRTETAALYAAVLMRTGQ
jgi:16S rRNA (uracil1498-N3)-methyltransferase